jgi:hypothetical protein
MDIDLEKLQAGLAALKTEYLELGELITRFAERTPIDQLQLQRLKKRRLLVKDQIFKVEYQLLPIGQPQGQPKRFHELLSWHLANGTRPNGAGWLKERKASGDAGGVEAIASIAEASDPASIPDFSDSGPPPVLPFGGREDISPVVAALTRSDSARVLITGATGSGKTAFVRKVANSPEIADRFRGCWFVTLPDPLDTVALQIAIVDALGLGRAPKPWEIEALREAIEHARTRHAEEEEQRLLRELERIEQFSEINRPTRSAIDALREVVEHARGSDDQQEAERAGRELEILEQKRKIFPYSDLDEIRSSFAEALRTLQDAPNLIILDNFEVSSGGDGIAECLRQITEIPGLSLLAVGGRLQSTAGSVSWTNWLPDSPSEDAPALLRIQDGPWKFHEFGEVTGVSAKTVTSWCSGKAYPRSKRFGPIERALFGSNPAYAQARRELRDAFDAERSSGNGSLERADPDSGPLDATMEQRPAAFRFGVRSGKIDALPEQADVRNRDIALDIFEELVTKIRALSKRLIQTNSDRRACASAERLLAALEVNFDDLRPGVLLSRCRSIEADRNAYDNEAARAELFPDAIAMMDDTLHSLHDLLATFPDIRRIEAERLALKLDQDTGSIPAIRQHMSVIKSAAAGSDAVTEDAVAALGQNDAATEEASDLLVRMSLVADQLLVHRNFASAVAAFARSGRAVAGQVGNRLAAELGEVGGASWQAVKSELPTGVGIVAKIAPLVGLLVLIGYLVGPVTAIGSIVPAFKPIANVMQKLLGERDGSKKERPPKSKLNK